MLICSCEVSVGGESGSLRGDLLCRPVPRHACIHSAASVDCSPCICTLTSRPDVAQKHLHVHVDAQQSVLSVAACWCRSSTLTTTFNLEAR